MTTPQSWPAPPMSGAGKARRPQQQSGRRRAEILEAAMAVFGERGYANGSLAEIAARIGMTHAGVLHHFGSKEQLLIALLEYRDDADVASLEGSHAPEGRALLEHLVHTVEQNATRPGIVQSYTVLLGESVTENHPAREFFAERFRGLRPMVVDALAASSDRDEQDRDVHAAADAAIAAMDGLQVQWLLDPDAVDMGKSVRLVLDALVARLSSTR